jgi:hypothetical protein
MRTRRNLEYLSEDGRFLVCLVQTRMQGKLYMSLSYIVKGTGSREFVSHVCKSEFCQNPVPLYLTFENKSAFSYMQGLFS